MKTLLIINPYSRGGKSLKIAERCMNYLSSQNFEFEYRFLTEFDQAYSLSREANQAGYDNIIAVGGDGTINKVINGFYDNNGSRISKSKFGVLYTGTSPDFCKSYNIPLEPVRACDTLIKGNHIEIPIGMIRFNSSPDNQAGSLPDSRFFACCSNIGLGAVLARKANSGIREYMGDFAGTFASLLSVLAKFRGSDYILTIDGMEKQARNVINLSVGITGLIASGIKVKRRMDNYDKQFYVLTTANIKMSNILFLLKKIYGGREFINSNYLHLSYCSKVLIQNIKGVSGVEFDGDPMGYSPCSIELCVDKLSVIS